MTENKKKKSGGSAIVRGLSRIGSWIERKIKNGFIGKILGSYTKENQALSKSFTASVIGRGSKIGEILGKIRFVVAEQFEESRLLLMWRKLIGFFAGCRLRFYGTFFMTFGVYIGLIYFFKLFFATSEAPQMSYIVTASVLIVSSLPLMFSGQTFASKLRSSKAGHFIAVDILGIPEEKMSVVGSRYGEIYNIAIFAGVAAGTISYFIDPIYILGAMLVFLTFALIITYPEIGVLCVLLFLPFFNSNVLNIIIWVYSFGYLIKLIRGKRILNFEIIDLAILFFAIVVAFSGSVSEGAKSSLDALDWINLILGAFVAGNLMRTKQWQMRCVNATLVSGTIVSMLIILQNAARIANLSYISDFFRGFVIFDGGEILSSYLIIALVFAYAGMFKSDGAKKSTILFLSTVMMIAAIIFLDSTAAWIGAVVASLLFFFIQTKKTFSVMLLAGIATPCVLSYTQGFLTEKFIAAFNVTAAGTYPMLKIWQGAMQLIVASMFGGVGIGGFNEFYPFYSVVGFESAQDSGALWLGLLCNVGIVGFVIFILVMFLCIQNCFEYLSGSSKKGNVFIVSGFAILFGLLVQSLFCDFFTDKCFFYAFWCLITVLCAAIRTERGEMEKNLGSSVNTEVSASLDL